MKLEDIPRREEALIVAEAQQRIDRLIITEHFDRRVASTEVSHVARAVWIGTLRGTPMTAEKITHTIGMPRATVQRKLDYLIRQGHAG